MKPRRSVFQLFRGFICIFLVVCIQLKPLGQILDTNLSEAVAYRQFLQAIHHKNYDEVFALGRRLAGSPRYEFVCQKIVQAAKVSGRWGDTQTLFEGLLPSNPIAYFGLGLLLFERGEHTAAITQYERCFASQPEFPHSLLALVDTYEELGQLEQAERYLQTQTARFPTSAVAHLGLGYAHAKRQRTDDAVREIDAALNLRPNLMEACYRKANVLYLAGRVKESQAALLACTPQDQIQLSEEYRLRLPNMQASIYLRLGQYAEATVFYKEVIKHASELSDDDYLDAALGQLAYISLTQGEYAQALKLYQQAQAVAKESGSRNSARNLLRYPALIGQIYFLLGDYESALQEYEYGVTLNQQRSDNEYLARLFASIGDIYAAWQVLPKAIDYYQRAVDVNGKTQDPLVRASRLEMLSFFYLKLDQPAKAEDAILSGLMLTDKLQMYDTQLKLLNRYGALCLTGNKLEPAINHYEKARSLAIEKNSPGELWKALAGMAAVYFKQGRLTEARQHYEKSLRVLESLRAPLAADDKVGFLHDKIELYNRLVAVLLRHQANTEKSALEAEAFHIAERARARSFSDLLAEAKLNVEQSLDAALLKQQQPLQQAISDINARLIKARAAAPEQQNKAEVERLESDLGEADRNLADWWRERNRRYADLKYPEPVDLPQAQQLLAPGQVMLAYSLGAEESYLFAVSRDGYQVWKLAAAEQLNKQAGKLLAALTDERGEASVWQDAAASLYQELIQPAAKFLRQRPATRELIILPDGALHRIPFEVLLEPMPGPITDATKLPYLVKRYALSYAPSATVLKSLKEASPIPARKPKEVIVFADPQYDRAAAQPPAALAVLRAAGSEQHWKFERLFNSAREAQGIAQVFAAKGGAELFLREQANEGEVKSPSDRLLGYRVVHFSAHGLVNERRPHFSGLVLTLPSAPRTDDLQAGDDGILSAYEIFNLKLNADLVTLSACETGLGKEVKGEGLMSLARGFMYAGTPSVLASLWKVDDAGTANLMIDFYRFWQQGKRTGNRVAKLNKAAALREAQLKAIASGSQPFYWAPFVLVGRSN